MDTNSGHTVTIRMLFCKASVHERNGNKQEAIKIREWVADFLCEQSKFLSPVWRRLRTRIPTTLNAICS